MVVGGRELIDTLWNVNVTRSMAWSNTTRINRYIMECKSYTLNSDQIKKRINRYIMECK